MSDVLEHLDDLSSERRALLSLWLRKRKDQAPQDHGIPRVSQSSASDSLPLSFAQQRLWFLDQLEPGNPFYNQSFAVRLQGALDVAALRQSLGEIVRRHAVLRTTFPTVNGGPVQRISPFVALPLPVIDLQALPSDQRESKAQQVLVFEGRQPFDLARGPVLRAMLLQLDRKEHVLLVTVHHIAADHWAVAVITRELAAFYEAFSTGDPPSLPELPIQYADFAVWQREWLAGEELEKQLDYWKRQLSGAPPVLELPTDRPRPPVLTFRGDYQSLLLPRPVLEALKGLSHQESATLFMTLLAAFKVLLYRYAGQQDVVVGTSIAGRNRSELEGLVGFFINTLVLRTDLSGNPTFRELVGRVRRVALGAYAHQDLPFEVLVEELQPERNLGHQPLFQVMFNFSNISMPAMELAGLKLDNVDVPTGITKFDLSLYLEEAQGNLVTFIEYNTDLFDATTITRMLGHFQNLLVGIVANPDQRLLDLPLLTTAERDRMLEGWNATGAAYPQDVCVHQLFEAQAARRPEAIAVVFENQHLSYGALERRANRLAHHLRGMGVGAETLVGVYVERSLEMVVGLLGVLKAGGAYVPLDPAYPRERLAFMLQDTRAPVLLTQSWLLDQLPQHRAQVVCLDTGWGAIASMPVTALPAVARVGSLAYTIYTSGSTGVPKGVQILHRAVVNFVNSMSRRPGLARQDILLSVTTLSFDIAVLELFVPLALGARVDLVSRAEAADGVRLRKKLAACGATVMQATPVTWRLLLAAGWRNEAEIKVLCGGEALPRELADRLLECPVELWNLYGPTETTVWSAAFEVGPGEGAVSIGRPIDNTQFYLLDACLQPVPVGVPGELYIGGDGLARGYLGRSDLTAERFVPHAFPPPQSPPGGGKPAGQEGEGARLYRTGDLARYLHEGDVEFLGRLDHQVKVRGFRIELGEIETALARHPAVRETVVVVREDAPGGKRLVAYLVLGDGRQPTAEVGGLRSYLKDKLPDYMLPSAFVMLEALPLTPNGKVNRRALPAPEGARPDLGQAFVAPRTPVEEMLAGVWAQVLGLERVGVHDNFFELGGHSLLATQVVSRVRDALPVELPLRALFETPTVAGLAGRVEATMRSEQVAPAPPLARVAREEGAELPLSFAQQRMVFLDQLVPDNPFYNVPTARRMRGRLDVEALVRTCEEIVRRHEVLRTTFRVREGRPAQVIAAAGSMGLPVVDLRALPAGRRERVAQRLASGEARRPFDLAGGPLLRVTLLQLGGDDPKGDQEEEHVLLLNVHHVVADAWSIGVLFGELSALYEAFSNGRPSPLPELAVQYADFAAWQRAWLRGEVLERQLDYWKQKLAGAPAVLELPVDRPRPAMASYRGAPRPFALPGALAEALKELSQREGVTLFMTLLAGFKTLLYRYSGQTDVVVGSPIAGRNRSEIEGLIGFFVNTLALRTELAGNPTFGELLGRVRETALGAYAHQDLPFEVLVEALQPQRDMSRNPLVQLSFALQNAPTEALELPGLTLTPLAFEYRSVRFDVELHLWETEEGLGGAVVYSTDLFDDATIAALIGHYQTLLEGIVADPERRLADLPLLTKAERRRLLVEWNQTATDYGGEQCVHELFEAQVARGPDATALVLEEQYLTYAGLNRRANQVAHHLRGRGVGAEVLVGVCMERSLEMVVGLLGVLKAGGAYLPLDPSDPPARLAFMVQDAGVQVLLTQQHLAQRLPSPLLPLDTGWPAIAGENETNPANSVTPDNLAYVIYTSGSTGVPKGAAIVQGGVVNYLNWCRQAYPLAAGRGAPVHSSISFDLTVTSLWAPLVTGGRVQLLPEDAGVDRLGRALRQENDYSLVKITPAHLQLLEQQVAPRDVAGRTRAFIIGGENLLAESLTFWQTHAPETLLVNEYGPTETVVGCCVYQVPAGERRRGSVPVGRPIFNTRLYVLDGHLNPVPVGAAGELYVGGAGVARGYAGRPALTAARFVPDPFPPPCPPGIPPPGGDGQRPGGGARLYKTGDLARYRPDGNVEFLGRLDHQVKIRSYRIELGEIEAVLAQHAAVREAVAVAREAEGGSQRLLAYVVAEPQQQETGGQQTDWDAEQVASWQALYDDLYERPVGDQDPTFNTVGWDSSYTGQAIPAAEMREWVENAVERILALRPRRVLEIGCGTGLLLHRIAPHCAHYVGTDFSAPVLSSLRQELAKRGRSNVTLACQRADEWQGLEGQAFDAVILNSVVQYFPSIEYLLRVLEGAVRVVAPGGFVFVGDVRSLPLLEALHVSLQLEQASLATSIGELRRRVGRGARREKELVIDPAFFVALRPRLPRVNHVEIVPKRGRARNEMTRFRYEVTLHVEAPVRWATDHEWLDWGERGMTLPGLQQLLREKKPARLGLQGVPNGRVWSEVKTLELLASLEREGTVGELRRARGAFEEEGVEPEDVRALGESLGYGVEVSWAGGGERYEVVFQREGRARQEGERVAFFPEQTVRLKRWKEYANAPLLETLTHRLAPQLRDFVKQRLPEYMVPSAFVLLEELPLTRNGKVDRGALPEPGGSRPELESAYVAPRDEVEETIAAIWEEVLRIDRVGVHDNFFELGGDSILSLQIIARVNQAGLELTLRQVFEHQTVAGLAAVARAIPSVQAEQGEVTGPVPLTPIQRWFFEQDYAEAHHYNQALLLQVRESWDPGLVEETVGRLLAHHDGLRLRFEREAGGWRQVIAEVEETVPFAQIDLTGLVAGGQREAIEAAAGALQASLDLAAGPLLRVVLFDLGAERADRLLVVIHHLAVDGVTWRILLQDLQTVYRQRERGQAVRLPPKTTSFKQWAEQLTKHAQSSAVGQALEEWLSKPWERVCPLPVDHRKGANRVAAAGTVWVSLQAPETQGLLQQVPQAYGTQINEVLLAALAQAFARWTGQDVLLVDLEGHGREEIVEGLNLSRTVGWFTSTFPVLLDVGGIEGPGEGLKGIKEQVRQISRRGLDYGLLRYQRGEAEVAARLAGLPQAEVQFNYLGQLDQMWSESPVLGPAPESSGPARSPRGLRRHVLEINGGVQEGRLQLRWTYSQNLHRRSTIEGLAQDYVQALRAIIAHCQSPQASGYTPSDFVRVKLSPEKLDKVFAEITLD